MDGSAPVANPSRPQSSGRSSQSPFLSDQPPPRLAADTTNLVLRQGRASGSRFHPGPGNAQDSTHMALDDSQNSSTDSPCEAEPKSEQNTPRAEEIPASAARRPRGRPRLETNDETPAERRRTQVRLAQRGFRQRKDNHLRNLERKVRELESAHESMCTEFTQFHDYLRAERLLDAHPLAAERLQIIADRFFASAFAAKEASGGSGDSLSSDADNEPLSAHDGGDSTASSAGLSSQMQRSSTVGHHQAYLPGSASLTPPGSNFPLSMSYEAATQAIPASSSFPLYAPMESISSNMNVPYYSMTPDTSTAGAFPYAGNEAFGRRLQRASVEASWRLITMANPPAERYAAVFGVRLFFESRETIIRRLRLFFGGAFHCEAALPPDEGLDHRMRIMYPGFEREFFNADGVEAYLGRLGISIPQNAAFVEAEVSLGDLEEAPTPWSPLVAGVNNLCVGSSDSMANRASGTSPSATWPSNGLKAEEHMAISAAPGTDTIQHPMAPALGGSSASGGAGAGFSTMLVPTRNWPRANSRDGKRNGADRPREYVL